MRTLTAPGLSVALEDTDPYRDCHQWPAADRLTEPEVAQWQQHFADAWREIERDYPAYAPAIAAGLTVLMPLAPAPAGRDVSATARHAFGAVGAALPADATTLALLIMHEFQHVKLGAVLDLYDLYDPADSRLYHAPWRADPRPLEGLLQGTYAHLAVTEFWRTRQQASTGGAAQVRRQAIRVLARAHPRRHRNPGRFRLDDAPRHALRRGNAPLGGVSASLFSVDGHLSGPVTCLRL